MTQQQSSLLSTVLFYGLLLTGVFTFLAYIGVPIHQVLFLRDADIRSLDSVCGTSLTVTMFLCRAPSAFGAFFAGVFQTMSPFFPYIIACAFAYFGFLFFFAYHSGEFRASVRVRPISLVLAFIASVWLLGTTFSLFTLNNLRLDDVYKVNDLKNNPILPPFSRFYEPIKELYPQAGEEGLAALQKNFEDLKARGCLHPMTNEAKQPLITRSGAGIFTFSPFCAQTGMLTRVLPQILLVLLFLFNLLVLGRFILEKCFRLTTLDSLSTTALSFGLGALTLTALLWILGVLSLLQSQVVGTIFFGLPFALFPWSKKWIKESLAPSIATELSLTSTYPFLLWLLISYLALNFLNVVRPFPIGWDDLGSYLNTPRLLSSYGSFIASLSHFQWEYLTSMGFTIFGYDSIVGSTFAMQINWAAGFLATFAVFAFARTMLGEKSGLLSAILYAFLPVVGHFSFADMKIDNATFFTSALGIFAVFLALEKTEEKRQSERLLLLAGALLSFSFAIKATAILAFLLAITVIGVAYYSVLGGLFSTFLSFAVLSVYGPLNLEKILAHSGIVASIPRVALPVVLCLGMVIIMIAIIKKMPTKIGVWAQSLGLLFSSFVVTMLPWGLHNLSLNNSLSITSFLGAPDLIAPKITYLQQEDIPSLHFPSTSTVRYLPPELKLNPKDPACTGSAGVEELDRYWGYSKGISHYALLPWRQMMNIDTVGYYVTLYPALFLFPLLLLLPSFWSQERRWLRLLFVGTSLLMLQWMFVGNGVIWYGLTMFLGLSIGLEALLYDAPEKRTKILLSLLLALSILICLLNRFWQFDVQRNVMEYPLGKTSAEVLQETTIMHYDDIRTSVLERQKQFPDRPYSFRIGTFIPYFIPRNREILPLADNQVSFFNCINQERDHVLTLKRLEALGFNSIIFDTNSATIEADPKGSLHQKVQAFIDFANDPTINLDISIYDTDDGLAYILLP